MEIITCLRQRWQTNSALESWLPARYLTFVDNPYDRFPRARIHLEPITTTGLTNAGISIQTTEIVVNLEDKSCESLIPQLDRIENLYDWSKFYLENDTVTATLRFRDSLIDFQNGIWTAQLRFRLILRNLFE